jgi:guanosine-3',5'-bis(diphosphate) 3'-pyrophosphohydrolase
MFVCSSHQVQHETIACINLLCTVVDMDNGGSNVFEGLDRLRELCLRRRLNWPPIAEAASFAGDAHQGQVRKTGEPYITHPIEVAVLVAEIGGSEAMVIAALLHDVIEDTKKTERQLRNMFGVEVTRLVLGCTKVSRVRVEGGEQELEATRLRNLFVALAADPRVVVIKIADRLHNMRTIKALPTEKARRIALETLTIHSPLAQRLGLGTYTAELEDRAFAVADPDAYGEVDVALAQLPGLHDVLDQAREQLSHHLTDLGISAAVSGRIKHRWSLYRKAVRYGLPPDHLHDLLGLRIIADDEQSCYLALEAVHELWPHEADRVKDYISHPKYNGYRSLHTVVRFSDSVRIEVQVRTEMMHREAEHGPASHWAYKNTPESGNIDAPWLQRLLEWHEDAESAEEFIDGVRDELSARAEIVLLTPVGDTLSLPDGATVIDFAYAVHTDVGHRAIGAKVDGLLVNLSTTLCDGQTVQIITGDRQGPAVEWIDHVRTSKARTNIRRYHNRIWREQMQRSGAEQLVKMIRDRGLTINKETLDEVVRNSGTRSLEDLHEGIGVGKIDSRSLFRLPVRRPQPTPLQTGVEEMIPALVGLPDIDIALARCCNPQSGTPVIGRVLRGCVKVHHRDCQHVSVDPSETSSSSAKSPKGSRQEHTSTKTSQKLNKGQVEVFWVRSGRVLQRLELQVADRHALFADIAAQVSSVGGDIYYADNNGSSVELVVSVDRERAVALRSALKLCLGVLNVRLL